MASYQFRPLTAEDLPLVRRWLEMPHVVQWWGKTEEQYALVSDDLNNVAMDQLIVGADDQPFAYLQCYDLNAWPDTGLGAHPPGTRGIDQFIGDPEMVDRGHGSAFIREYIEMLLASGTPRVVTDPDPVNVRAVRAYEKAGFHSERMVDTPGGFALLMIRDA